MMEDVVAPEIDGVGETTVKLLSVGVVTVPSDNESDKGSVNGVGCKIWTGKVFRTPCICDMSLLTVQLCNPLPSSVPLLPPMITEAADGASIFAVTEVLGESADPGVTTAEANGSGADGSDGYHVVVPLPVRVMGVVGGLI